MVIVYNFRNQALRPLTFLKLNLYNSPRNYASTSHSFPFAVTYAPLILVLFYFMQYKTKTNTAVLQYTPLRKARQTSSTWPHRTKSTYSHSAYTRHTNSALNDSYLPLSYIYIIYNLSVALNTLQIRHKGLSQALRSVSSTLYGDPITQNTSNNYPHYESRLIFLSS